MTHHTQKPTILVTGADLAPQALALLEHYTVHYAGIKPNENDLVALAKQINPVIIIVRYGRITPAIIDAAPALRVISKHGSGTDTIDIAYAQSRGIHVKAAIGSNANAVAEHTIALMLACTKSLIRMNHRTHDGFWDKSNHKSVELFGKTLGLVGLGMIGQKVAQIAHAMGMTVLAYDPYTRTIPDTIQRVDLPDIWNKSDVISLHCPLNKDNHYLLNTQTLNQCKKGVIVINTARGGLINEADLIQALDDKQVSCAGLDCFEQEPPPANHPFFGHQHIILSPHIAGVSDEAYIRMGYESVNNALSALNS